jgi:hypothetical protein
MIELRVRLKEEPGAAPDANGMGIRVYIDGALPAGLDTRQHDQIRLAILGQATLIAQYTIDHEMLPGDELPGGATAEPLFAMAMKLLRAAGAFDGDEDLEEDGDE